MKYIVFLIIIFILYYVDYIKRLEKSWYEFSNINNDIYKVEYIDNFFRTKQIIKNKWLIKQEHLQIKEKVGNEAIARYIITYEDLAVVYKNDKWLVASN